MYSKNKHIGLNAEDILELKNYLDTVQIKHPLPWKAIEAKSLINVVKTTPKSCEVVQYFQSECEDDCIVDANGLELLGCSEWLRVDWDVLVFLANSPEVIKNLIEIIENK